MKNRTFNKSCCMYLHSDGSRRVDMSGGTVIRDALVYVVLVYFLRT